MRFQISMGFTIDPVMLHANWAVGIDDKRKRLEEYGFWRITSLL